MRAIVRPKAREFIAQTWQSQANLAFFLALLVITVFVLPALPVPRERIVAFGDIVYTFVVISGVAIAWGRKWLFTFAAIAAVPSLVMRWAAWARPEIANPVWSDVFGLIAVVAITAVVLDQIFRAGRVNMMRVLGAVAAYLLLGIAYAFAYQIDWLLNPAAIQSSEGQLKLFLDWLYFSFCTLSTLGYGDIVPTSRLSRSLAAGEAITGQLFLAITIARLVAMQVSAAEEARGR